MNKKFLIILVGVAVIVVAFIFKTQITESALNLFIQKGNYYFNGGAYDLEKAARFYSWALIIEESNITARYQLSRIYLVKGDLEKALEEINAAIAKAPDFSRAYYIRGLINGFLGNLDQGEKDFKKILELAVENPETSILDANGWAVYNDLSWIQFQKGNYSDVEKTAREGLERYSENPWLLNSLGLALLNLEKKIEAREVLSRALALAEKLTPEDVMRAYPGNDPKSASDRRLSMINTITLNLALLGN